MERHCTCTVMGYIRNNFTPKCMIKDLIRTVIDFYNVRYNPELYIELICTNRSESEGMQTFLVPKQNIKLSRVLSVTMESLAIGNRIEIDSNKVTHETMHRILAYLGYHKGSEPLPILKPIRSVKMERIVEHKWDAVFIDSLKSKADIFEIITAANYLDIQCLLHLGAAKIASLIRGQSADQIRNILAQ